MWRYCSNHFKSNKNVHSEIKNKESILKHGFNGSFLCNCHCCWSCTECLVLAISHKQGTCYKPALNGFDCGLGKGVFRHSEHGRWRFLVKWVCILVLLVHLNGCDDACASETISIVAGYSLCNKYVRWTLLPWGFLLNCFVWTFGCFIAAGPSVFWSYDRPLLFACEQYKNHCFVTEQDSTIFQHLWGRLVSLLFPTFFFLRWLLVNHPFFMATVQCWRNNGYPSWFSSRRAP